MRSVYHLGASCSTSSAVATHFHIYLSLLVSLPSTMPSMEHEVDTRAAENVAQDAAVELVDMPTITHIGVSDPDLQENTAQNAVNHTSECAPQCSHDHAPAEESSGDGTQQSSEPMAEGSQTRWSSRFIGSSKTGNIIAGCSFTFALTWALLAQWWDVKKNKFSNCASWLSIGMSNEDCNATISTGPPAFFGWKRDLSSPHVPATTANILQWVTMAVLTVATALAAFVLLRPRASGFAPPISMARFSFLGSTMIEHKDIAAKPDGQQQVTDSSRDTKPVGLKIPSRYVDNASQCTLISTPSKQDLFKNVLNASVESLGSTISAHSSMKTLNHEFSSDQQHLDNRGNLRHSLECLKSVAISTTSATVTPQALPKLGRSHNSEDHNDSPWTRKAILCFGK
ncbi:hypothetical protein HII31_00005 [Pseudocercospora fuligena]|uniref:Uncharacterized protein n=1 Tax=Pseudocercospora fuligena TaxID=685502 RepID=A0A8H6RW65_9PEZI|nr:hypothetical protein HII31_00005 [Pseudocercospora fuligena]